MSGVSYEWDGGIDSLMKDSERRSKDKRDSREGMGSGHGANQSNLERSTDKLANRMKAIEDDLKKLHRSQRTVIDIVLKMDHHIRIEVKNREEKMMNQMRKEMEDMKSYFESQLNSSKDQPVISTKKLDIDLEVINSYVNSKVQDLISSKIEKLNSELVSSQQRILVADEEAQSRDKALSDHLLTTSSSIDKDLQRLRSDLNRVKSRCDLLEDATRELSSGRQAQERATEEASKRTLSTCRGDMRQIADSMTKRVNESIEQAHCRSDERLKQIDAQSKVLKRRLKELHVWKSQTDQQLALSEQVVVGIFAQLKQLQDDIRLHQDQGLKVTEMEGLLSDLRRSVLSNEESLRLHEDSLRNLQQSQLALQSAEAAMRAEVASLKVSGEALGKEHVALTESVQNLESWSLQNRDKLRDFVGTMKKFEIIDSALNERDGVGGSEGVPDDKVCVTESAEGPQGNKQGEVIAGLLLEIYKKKQQYRTALRQKLYSENVSSGERAGETEEVSE